MREELAMGMDGKIGWAVVTGGGGFIGRHVVDRLIGEKLRVHVIDWREDLQKVDTPDLVTWHTDCRSPEVWDAIRGYEGDDLRPFAVVHLAATVSMGACEKYPQDAYDNNVGGTIAALDGAVLLEAKRFVLASTAAVYPEGCDGIPQRQSYLIPPTVYGRTKVAAEWEALARVGLLDVRVLRFANVFGPGQHVSAESGVLAKWCSAIAEGGVLEVYGDGEQQRDFIHVKHVAAITSFKARGTMPGDEVENVSSGTSRSVSEVLRDLMRVAGDPVTVRYRPDVPGGVRRSVMPPGRTAGSWTKTPWLTDLGDTLMWYRDEVS